MAVSKLKITFRQKLIIGSTVSFNFKQVSTGIETPVTFTWVGFRSGPYQVTANVLMPNPVLTADTVNNFNTAFNIDEPSYPTEVTIGTFINSPSFIVITSNDEDITFSGGVSNYNEGQSALVDFEITRNEGILTVGLENDNYLINNEIWVNLSVVDLITRFTLSITNLNNGKFSRPLKLFSNNSGAMINLQPLIKSLFDYPNVRNQNRFQISIQAYNENTLVHSATIVKNLIRGGNRTELTNQYLSLGEILRPSLKLPVWDGFPTDEYYLGNDGSIAIRNYAFIEPSLIDNKKVKGCNNIYFRFLNQKGGYSNWLFESYSNTEINNNLGAFIRNNTIEDLGSEVDNSLSVFSKVPAEYYSLIKDLFISPDIYVWQDLRWKKVISNKNTSEYDTAKRAYSVKAKFIFENRFNPSLLWSN